LVTALADTLPQIHRIRRRHRHLRSEEMDDAALKSAIGLTDSLKAALGKLFEEEIAFTPGMKDRQKVLHLITNRAGISFRDLLRVLLTPFLQ
jgi:hypothetical protein